MIGIALSSRGLVKCYGSRRALDGFSLNVPQGAVMGLVGPNGAGKTTWMLTVAGILRPTAGEVDLLGRGPFDAAVHSGRVSILPQDSALPLEYPVDELLFRYARLQGLEARRARQSVAEVLVAVNLADRARDSIRSLSHGMRKRVMLAQCFLGEPELVMLDEPLNGLDPAEQDRMRRFILSLRGRRTVIVSSHNLNDVEVLCSHVAFIEKGKVLRTATVQSLTQSAGRVEYALAGLSVERDALLAELAQAMPSAGFEWGGESALVCSFDAGTADAAAVNRRLLPLLLARADVLAVTPGITLERAYLGKSAT